MGKQACVGAAVLALLPCCTAFNECKEQAGEVIGYTAIDLELRESALRYREMPIGNLIADSFYEVSHDNCGDGLPCPDIAVENAGAIRSFAEGGCDRRESIVQGPILSTDVESILPFANNHMVMADLTGRDIKLVLEHAVDRLTEINTSDLSGWFMQVSHLRFTVDCARQKYVLSQDGSQVLVTGERVLSAEVRRDLADGPHWEPINFQDDTKVYRVVTNDFIGGARDGHLAFAQRDASNKVIRDGDNVVLKAERNVLDSGLLFNDAYAVKRFIRRRNDQGHDVAPLVEGRITLTESCFRRTNSH